MFASYRRDDAILGPWKVGRSEHRFSPSTRKERESDSMRGSLRDRTGFRSSSVGQVVDCILASLPELQHDLADLLVVKNIDFA